LVESGQPGDRLGQQQEAGLYQSDFQLETLPLQLLWVLVFSGMCLGLLGSWLAVGRHLDAIEPS